MASTLVAEDNGFVRLTEDGEAAAVDAGGAGSTRDIAHRIGGAHGHTAGALQQLERDGLLECAGFGRGSWFYRLTPQGRALASEASR